MKLYHQYTAQELATDDLFIRWVQYPEDEEIAAYWQTISLQQPQLHSVFVEGRQLVQFVTEGAVPPQLHPDEVAAIWKRVRGSVHQPGNAPKQSLQFRYVLAGVVAVLVLAGSFFYTNRAEPARVAISTTTQAQAISLPDGSVVRLLPNSTLQYTARQFSNEQPAAGQMRTVWLTGCADFTIATPTAVGQQGVFRVHTRHLTAEGTSPNFQVRCLEGTTRIRLQKGELCLRHGEKHEQQLAPGESVLVAANDKPNR